MKPGTFARYKNVDKLQYIENSAKVYSVYKCISFRDCTVVTTMDLGTSLIAGTTIFGILGNLAQESDKDISNVVRAGTGLAFISYPEALAKFTVVPQLFAVLFFLMLFILGIGTSVAFTAVVDSVIKDRFPHLPDWKIAGGVCFAGFLVGIVYCTSVSVNVHFRLSRRNYRKHNLQMKIRKCRHINFVCDKAVGKF